jgi:hypothetical protein
MSSRECPRDAEVVAAARNGAWTESLHRHLETCPDCRCTAAVAGALLALASEPPRDPLPDPRLVWLRARRERARRAARRVDAITGTMFKIGAAAVLVSGLLGGRWLWPKLQRAVAAIAEPAASVGDPSALAVVAATLGALVLLVTWNRMLAGDR